MSLFRRILVVTLALFHSTAALAQDSAPPQVAATFRGSWEADQADISPPLRDILPLVSLADCKAGQEERDRTLGPLGPQDKDPVVQDWIGDTGEIPGTLQSWDAFTSLCGCTPPDPDGDVGPNHYFAMANVHFAIYDKTGTKVYPPGATTAAAINTIWSGFGGACETENAGDPVVIYDQIADRWLVTQFTAAGPTYYNCVALSTTGDPIGSYYRYAFTTGSNFPDYPKYGLWPDGYYIMTREFAGSTFAGVGAYALNRSQMLAGNPAPQVISFITPTSPAYNPGDGLLPADLDGTDLPPAGSPHYFVGTMDTGASYAAPQDALTLWKFVTNWATPASSSFTLTNTLAIASFDTIFPCSPGSRDCIPQQGTTQKIDILSYRQRPSFRLAYRNFGTHESLVTNQSVEATTAVAGVRWWEIRSPNAAPTIHQQGTYAPSDGVHRWMGSIAQDRVGNMALGFSASGSSLYPSIRYTGRLADDPLGTMPQGEGTIHTGTGYQNTQRWGDYTSMNVDPTDDCTFWYVNEYLPTNGSSWRLRVGSFVFPNCLCAVTPAAPTGIAASPTADNAITVSWNDAAAAAITRYFVYRSNASGGPWTPIATVNDTSPGAGSTGTYTHVDVGRSGGSTYYYVVRADDGVSCTSANSAEASATATGPCMLAPTFAGATSVANQATATCNLVVNWSAATSNCSGSPVVYNVYRSTTPGFVPAPANRVGTNIVGTSYNDLIGLVSGTIHYYVVRAVDQSSGMEDANTVQVFGTPTGSVTVTNSSDTFEGALSGGGFDLAGWTHAATSGTVDWAWSTTQSQTPTHSWSSVSQTTVSGRALVSPSFGVVASTTLSFWHTYDFEGTTSSCYDGGTLEITTNGGSTWSVIPDAAFTAGGFTGTIGSSYSNPLGGKRAWCDGTIGAMTQVTVNLSTFAGQTVRVRWHEGDDSSAKATGWFVDSVAFNNAGTASSCTPYVPPSVLPVPDGDAVSGTPLRGTEGAAKSSIDTTWDVSRPGCASVNYNLYLGALGAFGTITGGQCLIGATGSAVRVSMPDDSWWVVAGVGGSTVGSFGLDSSGAQRPLAGWGAGGACPSQTSQDSSGICP